MTEAENPYPQIVDPTVLGKQIKVADTALNRNNNYWRPLIGRDGVIIDKELDGLYDVAIIPDIPLVQGVKAERFIFIGEEEPVLRKPYWYRFQMSMFALAILCTVAAVLYLILRH